MPNEESAVSQEVTSFDLEGIGEVKARVGTSTHVLAGMAKYWRDKYEAECEEPRKQGFLSGLSVVGFFTLLGHAAYYLWSHH